MPRDLREDRSAIPAVVGCPMARLFTPSHRHVRVLALALLRQSSTMQTAIFMISLCPPKECGHDRNAKAAESQAAREIVQIMPNAAVAHLSYILNLFGCR
jgi:hypothetical protein